MKIILRGDDDAVFWRRRTYSSSIWILFRTIRLDYEFAWTFRRYWSDETDVKGHSNNTRNSWGRSRNCPKIMGRGRSQPKWIKSAKNVLRMIWMAPYTYTRFHDHFPIVTTCQKLQGSFKLSLSKSFLFWQLLWINCFKKFES